MENISWINFNPVYVGLLGRFLDILTTMLALSNPNYFEANPFYISWIFNLVIAFFACLLPQLTLLKWSSNIYWAYLGSYIVAITMYIPAINNIIYIM